MSSSLTVAAELRTYLMTHCMDCFPDYPEGTLREFFMFHSHFLIFLLPSSDKDAVAGSGFCIEPDMSYVCFDEVMA